MIRAQVRGRSMVPLLREGQEVILAPPPSGRSLRPGDIVAVRGNAEGIALHRVLRAQGAEVLTRGDATLHDDGPQPLERIVGLLVLVSRDGGRWSRPNPQVSKLLSFLSPLRPRRLTRILQRIFGIWAWRDAVLTQFATEVSLAMLAPDSPMSPDPERWDVQTLGNEVAVYDSQTGAVHLLNPVAFEIWQRKYRGEESGQIAQRLSERFPQTDLRRLQGDIDQAVLQLSKLELLPTIR